MSDEAVLAATGRDWAGWRAFLDGESAADMPHADIAKMLGAIGVKPWWRQMVTVGYERMIGRREIGQTCAGSFAANASKTLSGEKDEALARWLELVEGRVEFAGALVTGEPRITRSEKWRYWRIGLDNGSRATLGFSGKPNGKSAVGVNHEKLANAQAAAQAKAFWKDLLAQL